MSETTSEQWSALAAELVADPGAPVFAAVAESHRRAGRFDDSEAVVRAGLERCPESRDGRLVLALGLLDQGRIAEARAEFDHLTAEILAAIPAPGIPEVSDSEFDAAFEAAETDAEELIDPNRIAEEAVDSIDRAAGEGLAESDALAPGSAFATESMAALLERQGDEAGAARIRDTLAASGDDGAALTPSSRLRVVATLEKWLSNLRGESR